MTTSALQAQTSLGRSLVVRPPLPQPTKTARRRVRRAFDADKLISICALQDFSDYATRVDLEPLGRSDRRFYYYKDNGADVLGIAHLDSVQQNGRCTVMDTTGGPIACSGVLDDRLGAYVILELLPALGINCDWLLTTDEEMCQSTASDFYSEGKDYNWMFQFDRGGTDVVMYDYETDYLVELVEESGADVGRGSYSDIADLEHLGCAGFNWGVGYRDYHSSRGHAWLMDTFLMVARFERFYKANVNTFLRHSPRTRKALTAWDDQYCGYCQMDFDDWDDWACHMLDLHNKSVLDDKF